jgi:hypothetical protein
MSYLSSHLANRRLEIAELRNMNVLYAKQSVHNSVEQTASDVRAGRLLQIKQELSRMRDCPPEPKVWWDKE